MFSLLLKDLSFYFLFAITSAGVMPCGDPKRSPRASSIVQIKFSYWSFEISEDILRHEKFMIILDTFIWTIFNHLAHFRFASLCNDYPSYILENHSNFFLAPCCQDFRVTDDA